MKRRRSIAKCACESNPLHPEDWFRMSIALVLGLGLGYYFWKGSPASVETSNAGTTTTGGTT